MARRRYPWPNEINTRLHQHPQASMTPIIRHVWSFDCVACGGTHYLINAFPQPDGSLMCGWCSPDKKRQAWCPQCQQTKPETEFDPIPDSGTDALARALGAERCQMGVCHDCYAAPKVLPTCEHCGKEFKPARSDARFCSTKCRVAAHRSRRL